MSIACPRCHEQVDGVPDGCRDPNCPTFEIQQMELQRYNSIMAAGRAESTANVAYGAAKDAVVAAARNLVSVCIETRSNAGLTPREGRLRDAVVALDALETTAKISTELSPDPSPGIS